MLTEVEAGIAQILDTIKQDELALPVMPDLAMKVQLMLDDMNVSAHQIVVAVSSDPAFAAELIRVANSAIYADKPGVKTVMAAVTRLGYKMLRSLIMKITTVKLSNSSHPVIKRHLTEFMDHSREVAAISYALARDHKHLNPDQALLAGLIHDIGVIPICMYADKKISAMDEQACELIERKYCGMIGAELLRKWSFPVELIEVPTNHQNLQYESGQALPGYVDVVIVANLLSQPYAKFMAWENVTSVRKLGISPESCREAKGRLANDVNAARSIFFDN